MIYKKGSIIPRSLLRCNHRKLQFFYKFGCDVKIQGRIIIALSEGAVIIIPNIKRYGIARHRRPQTLIKDLTIVGLGINEDNYDKIYSTGLLINRERKINERIRTTYSEGKEG